jgi:hypothetical protein
MEGKGEAQGRTPAGIYERRKRKCCYCAFSRGLGENQSWAAPRLSFPELLSMLSRPRWADRADEEGRDGVIGMPVAFKTEIGEVAWG